MNKNLYYIDSSAYLGLLLGEKKALPLQQILKNRPLCSSILLIIESERNLLRLNRQGHLSLDQYSHAMDRLHEDREFFLLKDLTTDLCFTGSFPPVRIPRSLDLIHLRTAQWFDQKEGLKAFITLDSEQVLAAKEMGLPTN